MTRGASAISGKKPTLVSRVICPIQWKLCPRGSMLCNDRNVPVELLDVWEISGLLSLLEVDWALGWT